MRHDDVRDPGGERGVDGGVDLGPAEVPGREHEIVARDDRRARSRGRPSVSRTGSLADAGCDELVLDLPPDRLLGGLRPVLARLVLGVDRRQPDDPRAAARRDLDRLRVQPADAGVERDRAERVDAGHGARARPPRARPSARSAT